MTTLTNKSIAFALIIAVTIIIVTYLNLRFSLEQAQHLHVAAITLHEASVNIKAASETPNSPNPFSHVYVSKPK
jgi:hypothetical protein